MIVLGKKCVQEVGESMAIMMDNMDMIIIHRIVSTAYIKTII